MSRFLVALLFNFVAFAQISYDAILTGGRIVDGTGNAWFYGDLAIRDGRIDASLRVVFSAMRRRVISKVTQGVTTEIMGRGRDQRAIQRKYLRWRT